MGEEQRAVVDLSIDEVKLEAFYAILDQGVPPVRDWTELTEMERQELWTMFIKIKLL